MLFIPKPLFCFAISGPPTIKGIRKFPNPPIKAGITIKKIIKMACAVTILLYNWLLDMNWTPGPLSSNLIITEKAVPNNPENKANIKYKVGVSRYFELPSEPYVIVSHHTARHEITQISILDLLTCYGSIYWSCLIHNLVTFHDDKGHDGIGTKVSVYEGPLLFKR